MLLGTPPDCPSFQAHFDWPDAVVDLPYGSSEVAERIAEIKSDPDREERIRRTNAVNCLGRHDWLHRWKQILEVVGLEPLPGAAQRQLTLEERAASIPLG